MKKLTTLLLLLSISVLGFAQKQYQLGTETVFVPGQIVSTIKLVDYANKQIGTRTTHTSFDSKKAVFTFISTEGNSPYTIIMQVIAKDATKGLVPDIELKKAYLDPEEKTNPKNYWQVTVGFRKPNQDIAEVGSTEYYKNDGGTAIINKYLGTSYVVPFATKAAAEAFVNSFKTFIK
jgi:hypothetical protein